MMEFKLQPIKTNDISFNYLELKEMLAEKLKDYSSLAYTDDQIKDAKTDRATLNKLKKSLDDARKSVKKEWMKPYEAFEAQVKELIEAIDKPILAIDMQVKAVEEKEKKEKREAIEKIFIETEFPEFIGIDRIFVPRWLNKTYSLDAIREELLQTLTRTKADLDAIDDLDYPEYALEVYKDTLSLVSAISENNRQKSIAARTRERERAKKMTEEAMKVVESRMEQMAQAVMDMEEEKVTINFSVTATRTQFHELAEWLKARGIKYGKVDK